VNVDAALKVNLLSSTMENLRLMDSLDEEIHDLTIQAFNVASQRSISQPRFFAC
jgi:hypothetical protein